MWMLRLISRVPLGLLYLFSDFLFATGFYLIRYRRKVVQANLENSFPEKTAAERYQIEKLFYRNLADYAVETLKLFTISKEELQQRVVFSNPEIIQPYIQRKQSVLLLASHQFNWEWLLAAGSFGLNIPIDFVYQTQRSELFNKVSVAIRSRFGAYPIDRERVAREVIKRKHVIRGTAIVADQFPGHYNFKRYWTTFLGQRTAFFQGISQLMVLTQSPVFFAAIEKKKRGYYQVKLHLLAEPPFSENQGKAAIDAYVCQTEAVIHAHPDGWLWSHKRWKELDESD